PSPLPSTTLFRSITSAAHGLTTGTQVTITGVQGNTAANGTWTITVIDADTFSLNGSAGNGAYTTGGTWATTRSVTLVRNRTAANGNTLDINGAPIPPSGNPPRGLADQANMGRLNNNNLGTVFDDQAARNIADNTGQDAPFIGHFRPESGSLSIFNGLTRAQVIGSTWTLTIIDNRNDAQSATGTPPTQSLSNWTLRLSSGISTAGFGTDTTVSIGTVGGAITAPYPLVTAASGTAGIGPGIVIAA